jgi:hypothetical protein
MGMHRSVRPLRTLVGLTVAVIALSGSGAIALATNNSSDGVTGRPITVGTHYDRNASVVRDGKNTYTFFARSQLAPCNRLAGCDPDQRKFDLFYMKSADGGRSYGSAQLAATNPDPTPDLSPLTPYGGFRGRTIAAIKAGNKVTVFWADGGNERELYKVEKSSSNDTFGPPTIVPVSETVFNVEAITRGNQAFLYTEGTGISGYGVYAHTYSAGAPGPAVLVRLDRNIPKAIVDKRGLIRMTYVDATPYPKVDDYVTSSTDGIAFGPEVLAVAGGPNESNWDPNLLQLGGTYVLFFAPDRQEGTGKQQIAFAWSRDFVTWTRGGDITPGRKNGVEYWDYWPEPVGDGGSPYLLYASERGATDPTGIGHIWQIAGKGGQDDDDDHGSGHGHRWDED